MPRNPSRFVSDENDFDLDSGLDGASRRQTIRRNKPRTLAAEDDAPPADEDGLIFNGTRQERQYVTESLGEFFDNRWFRQVLYKVKGGKEANVYCCRAEPEIAAATGLPLIAAKVYRPRMFRAMHNDWFYKQGRAAHDEEGKGVYRGKDLRVARRNTRIGQKIDLASWCRWEYETLRILHTAGAAVPRPLAHGQTAILMEYLGDETTAAPTLHSISLDHRQARAVQDRLLADVRLALSRSRVHADLSAHNILWWAGRATVIDWPQAIDPQTHPEARELLERDIERLLRYFSRQNTGADPPAEAGKLSNSLWRQFINGRL